MVSSINNFLEFREMNSQKAVVFPLSPSLSGLTETLLQAELVCM